MYKVVNMILKKEKVVHMSLFTVVTERSMNWKYTYKRYKNKNLWQAKTVYEIFLIYYIQGVKITYINVTKTTASVRKK